MRVFIRVASIPYRVRPVYDVDLVSYFSGISACVHTAFAAGRVECSQDDFGTGGIRNHVERFGKRDGSLFTGVSSARQFGCDDIAALAAELGLCAAWLWNGNYIPGGTDMGKVYSAACLIAEDGNFAFVQEKYFRIYPFQTGGALFFATVFQLLGSTDYRILLALNGLSALVCVYLNYKIAGLAFENVRVSVLAMFCTVAFFPMVFLTSMIYGDLPSWMLCWLSIWLTMEALKGEGADVRWLVPVPFCLLLANVIRGVALLWCLSIGIVLVVYALGKRYRGRTRVFLLVFAAAILAAGLCSGALLHRYVEFRSGYSLDKGTPKSSWIAVGLQEGRRSCGGYDPWGEDVYTIYSHYDQDVANVKNIQDIKRRLSGFVEDPGYALYFFHSKLATEWADSTYQSLQVDYYEEPEGQAGNGSFSEKREIP